MAKSIKKDLSKVNKLLHPNSRKVAKLHGKAERIEAREKVKKRHQMKENLVGEKLLWFKERLDVDSTVYTKEMLLQLILEYLARFNEELEQIDIVHSMKHRQRRFASREDTIKNTIKQEELEFSTCGFEVPDLLNPKTVKQLKEWNEELRFLPNFRWQRYTRKFLTTPSKSEKKKMKEDAIDTDEIEEEDENEEGEEVDDEVNEEEVGDEVNEEEEEEEEKSDGEDEGKNLKENTGLNKNADKRIFKVNSATSSKLTEENKGESMDVDN